MKGGGGESGANPGQRIGELFDLSGKVAIVTGGSRGLGLEIAEGLGQAGASILIAARRRQWLESAERQLEVAGIACCAEAGDVSNPEDAERLISSAVQKFGQVDILVNCAGISWSAPALDMPLEKWRQVLDVNATGTFLMCQQAGRRMVQRGAGGRIINVASILGLGGPHAGVLDAVGYSASKGAVIALTRDLAVKWAQYNILVNAIAPSFFPTRLSEAVLATAETEIVRETPLGRLGRPGEIKGVAVFLASAASSYVTGQVIVVDGGTMAGRGEF